MARSVEPIPDNYFDQIAHVLFEWGELHPAPDVPVLMSLDGSELTPRDIASGMRDWNGPVARTIRMLFSAALHFEERHASPSEAETLDDMLRDFRIEIEEWRGGRR